MAARRYGRLLGKCKGKGENHSLPESQSFMMKTVPLAEVKTLSTRDGAGASPRFLTSRANKMQRCISYTETNERESSG